MLFGLDLVSVAVGFGIALVVGVLAKSLFAKLENKTATVVNTVAKDASKVNAQVVTAVANTVSKSV